MIRSFTDFITEEEQIENYMVQLTVEHGDKSITAKFYNSPEDGYGSFLSDFQGVSLTFDDGKYSIKNKDNSMEISSKDTVVFVREYQQR